MKLSLKTYNNINGFQKHILAEWLHSQGGVCAREESLSSDCAVYLKSEELFRKMFIYLRNSQKVFA